MDAVDLQPLGDRDEAALQRLLESDPGYSERVTGHPPGPSDALSLVLTRPDGVADDAKVVLGVRDGDWIVAVVDVIRDWPEPGTALIGLLFVDWSWQGTGLGRRTLEAVLAAPEFASVQQWRIAVIGTNQHVLGFWERMGFVRTGEVKPYRYDKLETEAIILTRAAART